jgi:hypothetical protein
VQAGLNQKKMEQGFRNSLKKAKEDYKNLLEKTASNQDFLLGQVAKLKKTRGGT